MFVLPSPSMFPFTVMFLLNTASPLNVKLPVCSTEPVIVCSRDNLSPSFESPVAVKEPVPKILPVTDKALVCTLPSGPTSNPLADI